MYIFLRKTKKRLKAYLPESKIYYYNITLLPKITIVKIYI